MATSTAPQAATTKMDPTSSDLVPGNFVDHILKNAKRRPPITLNNLLGEINYLNLVILTAVPSLSIYGALTTELRWQTAAWTVLYYLITGLGITAGYHRLWAHRSYNASKPLEYFLAMAGSGAVQGSIKWWSRLHRSHHRYTDTDLDPYDARKGFWWSHIGWMLLKPRVKPGPADVSDLSHTAIVRWQHRWYIYLIVGMGLVFPTVVAWLFWGDARGGFFFAGAARLCFVHHSTFCVNSLAHWIGDTPYDDKHSPKNHFITALVTVGEGYHNFHHQFPVDYRNAIRWYQYDPTKWFIWVCHMLGLASHLKTFPDNEIKKGELTIQLKKLRAEQEHISWPEDTTHLPVISWQSFQEQSAKRPLVLITGFIHDVSNFIDDHPGGRHLIAKYIGRDATPAFFGGVYDHSNAAHNLLSMMRVGILQGGVPHALEEKAVPPGQRLTVARNTELLYNPYSSTASSSDQEGDTEDLLG